MFEGRFVSSQCGRTQCVPAGPFIDAGLICLCSRTVESDATTESLACVVPCDIKASLISKLCAI